MSTQLSQYISKALPVASQMFDWSEAFNADWSDSLTAGEQAEKLQVLGNRAAMACSAVSLISDEPPEATGFDILMREAVRVRHAWVGSAIEQLECCESGISDETANGNAATSAIVAQVPTEATALARRYDASPSTDQVLSDDALGIELTAGEGWMVSASGLSPVLHAPFSLNRPDLSGLGPERWQLGTAIRIRRLRNPSPLDAATASERFSALISQQGSIASVEEVSVGGVPALRHSLDPSDKLWTATVVVFVSGEFTYFLETGCPAEIEAACGSVQAVASSLRLRP